MARAGQLAGNLRTGLVETDTTKQESASLKKKENSASLLDRLDHGKPVRVHIQEFACIFSIIFLIIGAVRVYRGDSLTTLVAMMVASAVLLLVGYRLPRVLHPVWRAWMGFAHYLGIVMTFVIMSIAWTVMFIPMALALRILGKKVMDLTFDRSVKTYWEDRPQKLHDFVLLEKQY